MEKWKKFTKWLNEHKAELIVAFGTIAIGIIIWRVIKREKSGKLLSKIMESDNPVETIQKELDIQPILLCTTDKASRPYTKPQDPVHVSSYLRVLPKGYKHSALKEEEAKTLDILLPKNMTIVDSYFKYSA